MGVVAKSLDDLLAELHEAKAMESACKEERIALEQQIVAMVEDAPTTGSKTLKGLAWKATVKFGMTYKADVEAIRGMDLGGSELPLKQTPAKWALDPKAYEALRDSRPDVFAKVAAHVTSKPSKPGVTLKA